MESSNINEWANHPSTFTGIVIYPNGNRYHHLNGKRHRLDGPAVECVDGFRAWYLNDILHRTDGPAYEGRDLRIWLVNGRQHRLDGPAYEGDISDYDQVWWIDGESLTFEKYWARVKDTEYAPKIMADMLGAKK